MTSPVRSHLLACFEGRFIKYICMETASKIWYVLGYNFCDQPVGHFGLSTFRSVARQGTH
jgi:hypothetical protein